MSSSISNVAEATRLALGSRGDLRGCADSSAPRFELFHAANSICSQKVRTVLEHHRLPYVSHAMNLFAGQTYLPEYVTLRMLGCERFGGPLVSHHSGSTSAIVGGCDSAVVPTLIDWNTRDVIVDSLSICILLDELVSEGDRLRPQVLIEKIDAQLAIVDSLPNYQMLMGRTPANSENDATKGDIASNFSRRKVAWCDRYLTDYAHDKRLVTAYRAKRAKEASAIDALFTASSMERAYFHVEKTLNILESLLERREGIWLFGEQLTMADYFWGIELLRIENLDCARLSEQMAMPQITGFRQAIATLPAVRKAISEWPGAVF